MTATRDPSATSEARIGARSTVGRLRTAGFALAVLGLLALNLAMTPPAVLTAAATGWVQDLGSHQVHDMTVAAGLWIALVVPLVLLLYRPRERVNTVLAPLSIAVPTAVLAFLAGSFLFPGFAVASGLALAAVVLHPAGRSVVQFDRVASADRRAAALLTVAAVPLVAYAGLELARQLGPVDDHVLFVHYGAMANAALFVVLMGGLAVVRRRDWRFAAWSAGLIAAFLGLASVAYPASDSSLGTVGGALLALWAVAFVAAVEAARRTPAEDPAADEGTDPSAESVRDGATRS
jgi:membrane-bound metal-dependent hydrolase YbcI (DUF457 family)